LVAVHLMPSEVEGVEPLDLCDFAFVIGPRELSEPAFSFDMDRTEVYTPEEIADAILAAPGFELVHSASPTWSDWKARWQDADRFIELDMLACPIDPDYRPGIAVAWGGSCLTANCLLGDLLELWVAIRAKCPGVWLHGGDCRLYSPESFATAFGGRSRRCI
jgi:hypothetical protein